MKEPEDSSYDEEQWERAIAEGSVIPAEDESGSRRTHGSSKPPSEGGPLPELDDLLKKVPDSSQALIDSLFRGNFIGVRRLDRDKLF